MKFQELNLSGLYLIESDCFEDERGFFARTFCKDEFAKYGVNMHFEQCSFSFNKKKGTLRGMHFQTVPFEEAKLIRCTHGAIYDVLIDLRPESKTFKKWQAIELSEHSLKFLYVPPGFAHGFQTLEDATQVFYQISSKYSPQHSSGVRWNDPAFSINWPLAVSTISKKDQEYPNFL